MAQLFQMRVRMKNLMGAMEGGSIPALSNLEESLKSEQKVSLYFSVSTSISMSPYLSYLYLTSIYFPSLPPDFSIHTYIYIYISILDQFLFKLLMIFWVGI